MSGDAVHAIEGRLKRVTDRVIRLQAIRDQTQEDLSDKKAEVRRLSDLVDKLTKTEELLRALMDAMVVDQVRAIEGVVTEGLQTIFHDQDLRLEAEIGTKYNKVSIDFYLRQGSPDDPLSIRGKPLESFGGGPASVSSLVLRVLAILRLKRYPILLLDEALGAVSDDYTEATGAFLRALAAKMGVPILMITHKPAFLDHSDVAYRSQEVEAEDGTRFLQMKKMP